MSQDISPYLMWNMTRKCNFSCKYCYFPHDHSPVKNPLSPKDITSFLHSTGQEWTVGMTGGEPMIYPGFADICASLARRHFISLDTNLSKTDVTRKFAEKVPPERVADIYAAVHIEEREKKNLKESFIKNAHILRDKGFKLSVNYVVHPTLLSRFENDRDFFAGHGIKILARPFKGRFENQNYPGAYPAAVKKLFKPKSLAKKAVFNFKGVDCLAGSKLLRLEPDGTVYRCSGDRTVLGKIGRDVSLYRQAKPCTVKRCPCFGPDFIQPASLQKEIFESIQLCMSEQLEPARTRLKSCLQQNQNLSNVMNNLAFISSQEGKHQEAVKWLDKALAIHPCNDLYKKNHLLLNAAISQPENRKAAPEICVDILPAEKHQEIFR